MPLVEREIAGVAPRGDQVTDHDLTPVVAKADRALKPISIALGVFGAVALLATVLVATQLVARRLRVDREDLRILRALGADPADIIIDGLIGIEAALALGSILAVVIAVALSPLSPLGPVAPVYPGRGLSWDWTVLGFGLLALITVLGGTAALLAFAAAPHRITLRPRLRPTSGARVVASAARAGLSGPGVVGVRMALEPGEGRAAVPVRSALLGSVLAVALVVTTLTFGDSLHTLVANPPLYGWNWTYTLNPVGSGGGEVPQVALAMLKHDKDVAAYSGASYNDLQVDGQEVPFLLENDGAPVTPPILTGHGFQGGNEVVLGAATMAQLHKHVGESVTISFGTPADAPVDVPPTRLRIVGTATFPAIGFASTVSDHTSMGTGVLIPFQVLPKAFVAAIDSGPDAALVGPNLVLVRTRTGVPAAAALANLQHIVAAADRALAAAPGGSAGNAIVVQGVQRPAEIANYKTIGLTPAFLVTGLVLGAIAALDADPRRIRSPATPRPGAYEDHRLCTTPTGGGRGVAGDDRRRRGDRGRDPARDRRRALALGPLRRADQRSAIPHGVRPIGRRWSLWARSYWPTSWRLCRPGRQHARRRPSCCAPSDPTDRRGMSNRNQPATSWVRSPP